jgi:outer membrane receptor for ferrienterochelin and colicins
MEKYIKSRIKTLIFLLIIIGTATLLADDKENTGSWIIKGKIIDAETKEPLAGANVIIKNTNIGVSTNNFGEFTLMGFGKESTKLQVSMVGYKSVEKEIGQINNYDNLIIELKQSLIEMGSVVVTGTNTMQLYEKSSVKTEIIPQKLIQKQNACNLAQALGLQTGVMVENDCNNCNFTQVRLLGFDGKYSQILIDGDPVISSLGSVYGLEHYPQEMIEQIEIVKGGGSALYGGGAVAGTINMMTRRPGFNRTKITYSGNSFDGIYDQQTGVISEVISADNNAGFFVYGSTRNRNAYDRNGDGITELGVLKNQTIGFNGFIKPFSESEFQISFHKIFEERRGGSELDKPVHEAAISEMVKHQKWGGKLKWEHKLSSQLQYKLNYAFSLLKRDSYYGGLSEDTPEARLQALKYYGFSDNPLHSAGLQINYFYRSNLFTAGIQYDNDKLLDQSVSSDIYYVNETFKNFGVFLQDEISFDEEGHTQLVAGVRFDKHSKLGNWVVSPRINLKYEVIEPLTIRAGFSTGFKAPQIFDEDLHICGLEGTQKVIRNANNLKEEKSLSYTIGFEFQDFVNDIPVIFGVTGFYTVLKDAYSERFVSSSGTIEVWERINSTGAKVLGFETDFGIKPLNNFEIRTGLTYKTNKYDDLLENFNTKNFLRTPDIFGFARLSYEFTKTFSTFVAVKYTGKMYVPHEVVVDYQNEPLLLLKESESFVELDISVSKKLNIAKDIELELTAGAKNITDAYQKDLDFGLTRDPGYVYGPTQPGTLFFAVNLGF